MSTVQEENKKDEPNPLQRRQTNASDNEQEEKQNHTPKARKPDDDIKIGSRIRIGNERTGEMEFASIVRILNDDEVEIQYDDEYLSDAKSDPIRKINLKQQQHRILTNAWLSCELRLDDFAIKEQAFSITGWINVFWIWHCAPTKLDNWTGESIEKEGSAAAAKGNNKQQPIKEYKQSEVIMYTSGNDEFIKILDLRHSALSYYLPIDATKIFYQPSLRSIKHIDAPFLIYNKTTKFAHIQYYIKASLAEHLELASFPFDKQFLNIKLRWNVNYFHILRWKTEDEKQENPSDITLDEQWWGDPNSSYAKNMIASYHEYPLKVDIDEELDKEIKLYKPWIDFRNRKWTHKEQMALTPALKLQAMQHDNLRFAMIRLRVRRNPITFCVNVLIPFFIIVCCSFAVFAIGREAIGERLGVSVTILLTFTAFQDMVAVELPQTSEMLWVDWYIFGAYMLQAALVLVICIIAGLENALDDDIVSWIEIISAGTLGLFWIILSVGYYGGSMIRAFVFWRKALKAEDIGKENEFWDAIDETECDFWHKRGNKEIKTWVRNTNMRKSFVPKRKVDKMIGSRSTFMKSMTMRK